MVTGRGSANVINPETAAFIAADAGYCLIGVAGGIIIGLAGYLLAVPGTARPRWPRCWPERSSPGSRPA